MCNAQQRTIPRGIAREHKTKTWLEKQLARLRPCPYFLLTFTLPAELRDFARQHQRIVYDALFAASSQAIRELAADEKFIGSLRCGFFGVLHTWGRSLDYHSHVHYVVPGGAVNEAGDEWLPSGAAFFLPVAALSILFRAKFRDLLEQAGLLHQIDPAVWRRDWVVHSQAVGDRRASLAYLAPYVYRVALSDRRIISCDDGRVTFSYRKSGDKLGRKMTVDAQEFIRRFLQHVLPRGIAKGSALRLPRREQQDLGESRPVVGHPVQRWLVRPAGPHGARTDTTPSAALRRVQRTVTERRRHPTPRASSLR